MHSGAEFTMQRLDELARGHPSQQNLPPNPCCGFLFMLLVDCTILASQAPRVRGVLTAWRRGTGGENPEEGVPGAWGCLG